MSKIIVYGNSDTRAVFGFPTEEDFIRYIEKDIFEKYKSRYQYSQSKSADVIVMARNGKAFGYFVVFGTEKPTSKDLEEADRGRIVYLIKESVSFERHVPLKSLGIIGYQFGKYVTEQEFELIKSIAGKKVVHRREKYAS